jgi:TonB family protein
VRAFVLFIALALVSQGAFATSREVRKHITTVEKQLEQMRDAHASIRKSAPNAARDWRGRTKLEDIDQWAYTPAVEERVDALLRDARGAEDAPAKAAMDEAGKLLNDAMARALEIARYWQTPSISWRTRWQAFAAANGLTTEPSDAQLLAAVQKVRAYLDAGDFIRAASASVHIDAALETAFRDAATERAMKMDNANLRFIPRTTPCPPAAGSAPKAGIARAASPQDYYPPASRRRDEQGAIMVRAHIAPTNCGIEFAVVVSSGFPELDEAALRVAEASTYVAATENEVPMEGYVTFRVRFTIKP